ncbi:RDD family protein [Pseudoclavibacter soli]|uniref:RDD family protein n=1 Tax=Pseudoclavibacter soli TaxID=452623 RepID=UPI0004138687|nr:RDD family protein [Pseudoclavibacter soli]
MHEDSSASTMPDPSAAVSAADLAGLGRRLIGLIVDWGLATLVSYAFFGGNPWATMGIWALEQITLVSTLGYAFGHLVTGIRVVSVHTGGAPGFAPVVIRTALLALFVPGLIWGKDGRPAHDRIAGTAVVLAKAARR